MNGRERKAVAEFFEDFIFFQTAQGLSEIVLTNYRHHFLSISKHFDIQQHCFIKKKDHPRVVFLVLMINALRACAGSA